MWSSSQTDPVLKIRKLQYPEVCLVEQVRQWDIAALERLCQFSPSHGTRCVTAQTTTSLATATGDAHWSASGQSHAYRFAAGILIIIAAVYRRRSHIAAGGVFGRGIGRCRGMAARGRRMRG